MNNVGDVEDMVGMIDEFGDLVLPIELGELVDLKG